MSRRLAGNRNLTILNGKTFNGMPVYASSDLIENYLCSIDCVLSNALIEHPRTLVIRCDLHFPPIPDCSDYPMLSYSKVMTRFMGSLRAQIRADLNRKQKRGVRAHPCGVRYVWARERCSARQDHYHVVILLNNDAYNVLGSYEVHGNNNATRIVNAWASALGLEYHEVKALVHFPKDTPIYYLKTKSPTFTEDYQAVFKRLSYFAKVDTKHFGTRANSFGSSRY